MYRVYLTYEDAPAQHLEDFETLEHAERVVDQWLSTDALDRSYRITRLTETEIVYRIHLVAFAGDELEAVAKESETLPLSLFDCPTLAAARHQVEELRRQHPRRSYEIVKVA